MTPFAEHVTPRLEAEIARQATFHSLDMADWNEAHSAVMALAIPHTDDVTTIDEWICVRLADAIEKAQAHVAGVVAMIERGMKPGWEVPW